jgi:dihydroorotase
VCSSDLAIELGKRAECHIHIAHISTKETAAYIRQVKSELQQSVQQQNKNAGFSVSCEVTPHHLCLNEQDAEKMGITSYGRVNPPLGTEDDRKAMIDALADGTIDAIATDHAPHSDADKEKSAPGFSGLETAFAAIYTELIKSDIHNFDLKRLSSLMSAEPARLLGLNNKQSCKRGRILPGFRADLVLVDPETLWTVNSMNLKTRGKNSPFIGRELFGTVLLTIRSGRIVYHAPATKTILAEVY